MTLILNERGAVSCGFEQPRGATSKRLYCCKQNTLKLKHQYNIMNEYAELLYKTEQLSIRSSFIFFVFKSFHCESFIFSGINYFRVVSSAIEQEFQRLSVRDKIIKFKRKHSVEDISLFSPFVCNQHLLPIQKNDQIYYK